MPVTRWIARGVATVATVGVVAALCFDWLFEMPTAVNADSFVQHLKARTY